MRIRHAGFLSGKETLSDGKNQGLPMLRQCLVEDRGLLRQRHSGFSVQGVLGGQPGCYWFTNTAVTGTRSGLLRQRLSGFSVQGVWEASLAVTGLQIPQ